MRNCLKCNDPIFQVKNLRFDSDIKKQIVQVIVPCHVCQNCGESWMDNEQMNLWRKVAADRYREMNGLLTSKEIYSYREKLGFSQIAFARFLGVGEASIKRWETYYIQDESQDDHIRIKCDQLYSESNSFYLRCKYGDINIYSGLTAFSANLIRQVSERLQELNPECLVHLGKLYFYTDFLHFKRHNRCITGMRYTPVKSGPAPDHYDQLVQFVQCKQFHFPKSANFDDQQKKTMEDIVHLFFQDEGQMICNLSAKEKGFLETNESKFISYKYAKDLLI